MSVLRVSSPPLSASLGSTRARTPRRCPAARPTDQHASAAAAGAGLPPKSHIPLTADASPRYSAAICSLAYACEGVEASPLVEQRLRKIVGDDALADPDPETRALYLDKPVDEYAVWIQNTMHWGGENEILTLSKHYNTEIAVVSCESMSIMVYNEGADRWVDRSHFRH
jgi:hypothetical protein